MTLTAPQRRFVRLFFYVAGVAAIFLVLQPLAYIGDSVRVGSRGAADELQAISNGTLGVLCPFELHCNSDCADIV